ncbi:MAG: uroporphyrinogen decarboxylase family protein [Victivallales bacterium]
MQKLTKRENFLRAARRLNPQWVPLDFAATAGWRKKLNEYLGKDNVDLCGYFDFDGAWLGSAPPKREMPDWRRLYYEDGSLPENAQIDPEFGTAKVFFADSEDEQRFSPLRNITTVQEVDEYPWPTKVEEAGRWVGLREKVIDLQQKGLPVHVGGFRFFETVWALRGFEQLMVDMAEDSPVAHRLFERMGEVQLWRAEFAAKTGADVIMSGDDVATQRGSLLGDSTWRKWVFPLFREAIQTAKKNNPDVLIKYHSCGNVSDMIDGFLEAGIDILDPCQPECMDIFELKRRYGKVLTFHGGIGVQSVLPHGTPSEVREMTRKTLETMAEGGGYLCSASHNVDQFIPVENILAFAETVHSYKY